MSVGSVLECQVAVDTNQLVDWRLFQIEDHVPSWFDVNVFTLNWHSTVWPILGVIPVSGPVLIWHTLVQLLTASTDTPVSDHFYRLFLIWMTGLILWRDDEVSLTDCSCIVNYILTQLIQCLTRWNCIVWHYVVAIG